LVAKAATVPPIEYIFKKDGNTRTVKFDLFSVEGISSNTPLKLGESGSLPGPYECKLREKLDDAFTFNDVNDPDFTLANGFKSFTVRTNLVHVYLMFLRCRNNNAHDEWYVYYKNGTAI